MASHKLIIVLCGLCAFVVIVVAVFLHYVSQGQLSQTFDKMMMIVAVAAAVISALTFIGMGIVDHIDKRKMFRRDL